MKSKKSIEITLPPWFNRILVRKNRLEKEIDKITIQYEKIANGLKQELALLSMWVSSNLNNTNQKVIEMDASALTWTVKDGNKICIESIEIEGENEMSSPREGKENTILDDINMLKEAGVEAHKIQLFVDMKEGNIPDENNYNNPEDDEEEDPPYGYFGHED